MKEEEPLRWVRISPFDSGGFEDFDKSEYHVFLTDEEAIQFFLDSVEKYSVKTNPKYRLKNKTYCTKRITIDIGRSLFGLLW